MSEALSVIFSVISFILISGLYPISGLLWATVSAGDYWFLLPKPLVICLERLVLKREGLLGITLLERFSYYS